MISAIIQILRWLEKGIDLGGATLAIPNGLQEITIGLVMIVILMFRPPGLTRNRETRLAALALRQARPPRNWRSGELLKTCIE